MSCPATPSPQAFFKEAYKARVRKQHDGDDGRSYSGRGGRSSGQRPDGWLENLCQVGLITSSYFSVVIVREKTHVPCLYSHCQTKCIVWCRLLSAAGGCQAVEAEALGRGRTAGWKACARWGWCSCMYLVLLSV